MTDASKTDKSGAYQLFMCPELNYAHSYCRSDWCGEAVLGNLGDPAKTIHIFDLPKYPERTFPGWNKALHDSDDADWSNDTQYAYGDSDDTMRLKTSFNFKGGMPYWLRFPGVHNGRAAILFMDSHVATFNTWDPNKMTFRWGNRTIPLHRS